jgi:hypothetical protein
LFMRKILFAALLLSSLLAQAQQEQINIVTRTRGNLPIARIVPGVAGQCLTTDSNGNTAWATCAAGGGGSGTVTTFSAGNLSPLFTSSVATATTTPALSFTLSNAAAHTFFGNNTGSSAAPAFSAITAADLPGVFAQTLANVAHKWLNSYNATTGLFTQTQPDYSDLTGTPQLPLNTTSTAHQFFTAYNSTTGAFTKAQPDYSDLTGTPTLPATLANAAHKWFNSYNSVTGLFTQTSPDYSDLTGVPSTFAPTPHNLLSSAHGDTTAAAAVRGDGVFAIGVTPTWQRLAHGTTSGSYFKWNGTDIVASTNAASGTGSPTSCTNQFVTAFTLNADAAPTSTCSTVSYGQVSGTPTLPATLANAAHKWLNSYNASTGLFTQTQPDYSDLTGTPTLQYQTVQDEGTPLTQRAAINFTGAGVSCADNAGSSRTDCTITGGGGGSTEVQVDGVDTTAQTPISFNDGAIVTFANPSAGNITADVANTSVTRAKLAADAVGWQFLGCAVTGGATGCTTASGAIVAVTPGTARKHCMCRLIITGYAGGGGVARAQFGNTSTPDTGTNYAFGGFSIASGTSTAPTVTGIGSGSTAQNGVPVSGTTTTAGRFVQMQISNAGAAIKYFTIETSGIGASAAVTPNLAHIAGTWNNTTNGIGVLQFTACSATTGTCTTVNFNSGTTLTCWGRDDS